MRGNNRVRFCSRCNLRVYNFAALREDQIRELLRKQTRRVCGRLYRRPDGTILTQECEYGRKRKLIVKLALAAASVLLVLIGLGRSGRWDAGLPEPFREFLVQAGILEPEVPGIIGVIYYPPALPPSPPSAPDGPFMEGPPGINVPLMDRTPE